MCSITAAVTIASSVREYDDVAGLDVRRWMLERAEVVAGMVVETVDRHDDDVVSGALRTFARSGLTLGQVLARGGD
jgi:hypothetical protein